MTIRWCVRCFSVAVFLSACASFQLGGEFLSGRQAYLRGDPETALGYFHSVARKDPGYAYGTALRQSIWSYAGRAEYATGRYSAARNSLEKALSFDHENSIARLYFGLASARSGDREGGSREIERGLRGMRAYLEYVTEAHRFSYGQFWDPSREIRRSIERALAIISKEEIDWQNVITAGELLGMRMEEEIDRARRDERTDLDRDSEGNGSQP